MLHDVLVDPLLVAGERLLAGAVLRGAGDVGIRRRSSAGPAEIRGHGCVRRGGHDNE